VGSTELGTRVEIKNLNSFKTMERGIAYEVERQAGLLDKGERVIQETLGWNEAEQRTYSQRSKEEAHDYLWRIHQKAPANGEIVIFNRSQYEDVLVVRVHELDPEKVWKKRYQEINEFERMLSNEGTTILKFFLFISKDEQKKRFIERLENPEKQWKFNPGDIEERKYWDAYMQAYQDVIDKTSKPYAPWYVIPANHNWYRDLVISHIIVKYLKNLKMAYPEPAENIHQYLDPLQNS